MTNNFISDWKVFADDCHQQQKQTNQFTPLEKYFTAVQNQYPTLPTREQFTEWSFKRVDTLINNMRVTTGRSAEFRKFVIQKKQELKNNQLAETDTIVISGKKPKYVTIRQPSNGQVAFIDWANFTFDVSTIHPKYVRTNQTDDEYMALCQSAVADLNEYLMKIFGNQFIVKEQNQTGRNFYKYSFNIGEGLGLVCIGGQRNSVLVMLTGRGCALARHGWEYELHTFLSKFAVKGKLTRIDLAHDDMKGEYLDVYELDQLETTGGFHCGGARPEVQYLGNWKNHDPYNKGLTLAIGNRSSGKYARFYQKGKKEGDKESFWTRAEVEFKSVDRVIPLDVLLDPSGYFLGAYPCFADLFEFETANRIKTNHKTGKANLLHSFDWIKKQTGKYLTFYRRFLSDTEIVDLLKHDDDDVVPDRLYLPYHDTLQTVANQNIAMFMMTYFNQPLHENLKKIQRVA